MVRRVGDIGAPYWSVQSLSRVFSADGLLKLGQAYLRTLRGFETNAPLISDKMPLNFRWIVLS